MTKSNPLPNQSIRRNNIKVLRTRSRLSQADVARLVGGYLKSAIDPSTISYHENGIRLIEEKYIEAYARVFKVPVAALYADLYDRDMLDTLLTEDTSWTNVLA